MGDRCLWPRGSSQRSYRSGGTPPSHGRINSLCSATSRGLHPESEKAMSVGAKDHVDLKCPQCTTRHSLLSKGLYHNIRVVLDLNDSYYLTAEYFQCKVCDGTYAAWDHESSISLLKAISIPRCPDPSVWVGQVCHSPPA